jgi:transcriptional regulator with XRE-family HTH domain
MVSGAQIRMGRAAAKLGVRELAAAAKVSPNTITRVEADGAANASTISALQRALESAGVEFLPENGVRLKTTNVSLSGGSNSDPSGSSKPGGKSAPRPRKPTERKAEPGAPRSKLDQIRSSQPY